MITSRHHDPLPQLGGQRMLTDSGLETTLMFHEGLDLPCFASFPLLDSDAGRQVLIRYFRRHAEIAGAVGWGFIFDTPTWRANPDWGQRLGYDAADLLDIDRRAVELLASLRDDLGQAVMPSLISGNIGPRGDGYVAGARMSAAAAEAYHRPQIEAFASAGVDMVTAMTIPYVEEAVGIARAAAGCGVPAAIGLTVETDGRLPSTDALGAAIETVDVEGGGGAAYFMVNCAHPDHFRDAVAAGEPWTRRILGVRANASRLSHAELDAADTLDDGDPQEFGRDHVALLELLPGLRVFGGCCGTDHRHIEAIVAACDAAAAHTAAGA